jgi:hypothetical protein
MVKKRYDLTKRFAWLYQQKSHNKEPIPTKIRTAEWHLRNELKGSIQALEYFAKVMPEAQLIQVYTKENIEPLVKALMRPDISRKEVGKEDVSELYSSKKLVKNERMFALGCMFLNWSLNITGSLINNEYASRLWMDKEKEMRPIVEMLYYDVFRKAL